MARQQRSAAELRMMLLMTDADLAVVCAAAAEGIDGPFLIDTFREMYEGVRANHEREAALRKDALRRLGVKPSHPAFVDGDWSQLADFDVVADGLRYEYPEFMVGDDPSEALYELLCRPQATLGEVRLKTWRDAASWCASHTSGDPVDAALLADDVPF
jgi:hypothetical protein